jgi:3-oxoacyl-[acyl-carrier-protein] synthase-1
MVTSVGFNAPATCAALRAGVRTVYQTNLWDAETGSFLAAGKVPLPQWWVGTGKLADLVAPAILECVQAASPLRLEDIPILLGVADPRRPYRDPDLEPELMRQLEFRLGRFHPDSLVIPDDRVATIVALRHAQRLLGNTRTRCVIIASVDSLIHTELKDYYLSKRRLLTPSNSNGFCLGEAGSAVLVVRASSHAGDDLRILGLGTAREEATIESEEPLRANGLVQAIRQAYAEGSVTYQDIDYRISDVNGEHYKFKEMAIAMMRFERQPKEKLFDLWHPIEYIGDVGAAIGPILLGWALHANRKRYAIGPRVLCTLGNDEGARGAMVLAHGMAVSE